MQASLSLRSARPAPRARRLSVAARAAAGAINPSVDKESPKVGRHRAGGEMRVVEGRRGAQAAPGAAVQPRAQSRLVLFLLPPRSSPPSLPPTWATSPPSTAAAGGPDIPPVRRGARQAQRGDGGQRGAIDHQEGVERESGRQRACGWVARRARPPRVPRLGRPGAGSRAPSVTGDALRSLHARRRAAGFSAVPIQPPPFLSSRSTAAARGTRAPARPTASSF